MARAFISTQAFRQAYRRLRAEDRARIHEAWDRIASYLERGRPATGLTVKALGQDVREIRVTPAIRIVCVTESSRAVLALLGTHDEIRRALKR